MKAKLTVTIEEDLIPRAKVHARSRGLSLSQLIEKSLREEVTARASTSFSQKWRGRFVAAERNDDRYEALAKRYL